MCCWYSILLQTILSELGKERTLQRSICKWEDANAETEDVWGLSVWWSAAASGQSAGQTADGAVTGVSLQDPVTAALQTMPSLPACVSMTPEESRVTGVRASSEGTGFYSMLLQLQIGGAVRHVCVCGDREQDILKSVFLTAARLMIIKLNLFMFISGPQKHTHGQINLFESPGAKVCFCVLCVCTLLSPGIHQVSIKCPSSIMHIKDYTWQLHYMPGDHPVLWKLALHWLWYNTPNGYVIT